ncbi:tetratricopeptide repeat protein [Pseudooceanicola sp. 200-1SW]|uniref:tetratricopeptide repeat protein n=1 Tax=Pseudooceanicola sp. 200-1SW TaxID=3425949 RepID=UPI003D7FEBB6
MSDADSFIEEVNDEVRRDRLFALLRRYGWIAVVAVVLIVGGAAWNEWQKAQARAEAEAFGDAILAALDEGDSEARIAGLEAVAAATPEQQALLAFLTASEAAAGAEDPARAADALADTPATGIYADIARFKRLLLETGRMAPADRRAALLELAVPGNPLRLLAEEQIALTHVAEGDSAQAIGVLRTILGDAEVTEGLRQRASQLMVALGGDPAEAG